MRWALCAGGWAVVAGGCGGLVTHTTNHWTAAGCGFVAGLCSVLVAALVVKYRREAFDRAPTADYYEEAP